MNESIEDLEKILAEKVEHEEKWEQLEIGKVKPVYKPFRHRCFIFLGKHRECTNSPFMFMRRRRRR